MLCDCCSFKVLVSLVLLYQQSLVQSRAFPQDLISSEEGYRYPEPSNPLTLPPRKSATTIVTTATTTTTTTTSTTTSITSKDGYDYPVPNNPLTLPSKPTTTTTTTSTTPTTTPTITTTITTTNATSTVTTTTTATTTTTTATTTITTTTTIPIPSTTGYDYPEPDNPLNLPSRPTTSTTTKITITDATTTITTTTTTTTTTTISTTTTNPTTTTPKTTTTTTTIVPTTSTAGYDYPEPENPLTLPSSSSTTTTTTTTTITTTATKTTTPGYEYPEPEDPLTLPAQQTTTTRSTVTTTAKTTTTTTHSQTTTLGYGYPEPENPLTLPAQEISMIPTVVTTKTTTAAVTTVTTSTFTSTTLNPTLNTENTVAIELTTAYIYNDAEASLTQRSKVPSIETTTTKTTTITPSTTATPITTTTTTTTTATITATITMTTTSSSTSTRAPFELKTDPEEDTQSIAEIDSSMVKEATRSNPRITTQRADPTLASTPNSLSTSQTVVNGPSTHFSMDTPFTMKPTTATPSATATATANESTEQETVTPINAFSEKITSASSTDDDDKVSVTFSTENPSSVQTTPYEIPNLPSFMEEDTTVTQDMPSRLEDATTAIPNISIDDTPVKTDSTAPIFPPCLTGCENTRPRPPCPTSVQGLDPNLVLIPGITCIIGKSVEYEYAEYSLEEEDGEEGKSLPFSFDIGNGSVIEFITKTCSQVLEEGLEEPNPGVNCVALHFGATDPEFNETSTEYDYYDFLPDPDIPELRNLPAISNQNQFPQHLIDEILNLQQEINGIEDDLMSKGVTVALAVQSVRPHTTPLTTPRTTSTTIKPFSSQTNTTPSTTSATFPVITTAATTSTTTTTTATTSSASTTIATTTTVRTTPRQNSPGNGPKEIPFDQLSVEEQLKIHNQPILMNIRAMQPEMEQLTNLINIINRPRPKITFRGKDIDIALPVV